MSLLLNPSHATYELTFIKTNLLYKIDLIRLVTKTITKTQLELNCFWVLRNTN